MSIWSRIPVERMPQLWAADADALRAAGIETATDLVRAVRDKGLKSLSDSSGIPLEPLDAYVTAAEGLVASQKILRRASVISGVAVVALSVLTITMFFVQSYLPPPPADSPEAAYADLQQKYAGALDQHALLEDVTKRLDDFELINVPEAALVNLRLLSSAVQDSLALETLQSAGGDPSSPTFGDSYRRYKALFNEAREQQSKIASDDPRIGFAHVNAARAWTNHADLLGVIAPERYAAEIRDADAQARLQANLARDTRGLSTDYFAQRIDALMIDLENQATRGLRGRAEQIQRDVDQVKRDLGGMQAEVFDLRGTLDNLQSTLSQILTQLANQETSIIGSLTDEHVETRDQIGALVSALDSRLTSGLGAVNEALGNANRSLDDVRTQLSERVSFVVFESSAPSRDCGLVDLESARLVLKNRCVPRRGLTDPVRFEVTVTKAGDGEAPTIVALGPSDSGLICSIDQEMAQFDYQPGLHRCQLVFRSN